MQIHIREIEAETTYAIRQQVMWPNKPIAFVKLPKDKEGVHFGLFKDSEIISIISFFKNGNSAQFRKFATKISEQGNGYGSILLNHIFNFSSNDSIEKIWCNARIDKALYYEKFGMIQTSKTFVKEGQTYVVMEKKRAIN